MANNFVFNDSLPVAPLKLAALESCKDFASKVDSHIVQFRRNDMEELKRRKADLHYRGYDVDSYLLDLECPRFGTGEAKAVINESVRGTDIFVMADVMNYSIPYTVCGYTNHMSPDDHFQDMKRVIGSCVATAHRVNVVMPFLYESRQHKRSKRESLDCAMALEELIAMGLRTLLPLMPMIQECRMPSLCTDLIILCQPISLLRHYSLMIRQPRSIKIT